MRPESDTAIIGRAANSRFCYQRTKRDLKAEVARLSALAAELDRIVHSRLRELGRLERRAGLHKGASLTVVALEMAALEKQYKFTIAVGSDGQIMTKEGAMFYVRRDR